MYSLSINTKAYDIKLLAHKFGKKTGRTIKKKMKIADPVKMRKQLQKSFASLKPMNLSLPWI